MKIDVYLDTRFGQGSIQAITLMADIAELKKMLTEEVVHFVFEKTDGTRRDAYGTRAIDVIRKYDTGSTSQKPQRAFNGTFPYFDIEKGEWRCFTCCSAWTMPGSPRRPSPGVRVFIT